MRTWLSSIMAGCLLLGLTACTAGNGVNTQGMNNRGDLLNRDQGVNGYDNGVGTYNGYGNNGNNAMNGMNGNNGNGMNGLNNSMRDLMTNDNDDNDLQQLRNNTVGPMNNDGTNRNDMNIAPGTDMGS